MATGEVMRTNETSRLNTYHSIAHGLDLLAKADVVIGHNFINFDARQRSLSVIPSEARLCNPRHPDHQQSPVARNGDG